MKLLMTMAFVFLAGGLVVGQESTNTAPASGPAQGNLSQEVKALRDALAQQRGIAAGYAGLLSDSEPLVCAPQADPRMHTWEWVT